MSNLRQRLDRLSPAARRLALMKLEARRTGAGSPTPEAVEDQPTHDGPAPLSHAQQRLWFLDQLESGAPHYNEFGAQRLSGRLDLAALRQALRAVVARHEALRTVFPTHDGQPRQLVRPPADLALPVVDLTALPETTRRVLAQRLAAQEAVRAFDLARGPLLRLTLLRLGEHEHVLLMTLHHIVCDRWSAGILIGELKLLYRARVHGAAARLAPLAVQYTDFARWQRRYLEGTVMQRQLAYWRARLEGAPTVLDLPADHPRPAVPSFRGRTQSFSIGSRARDALLALAKSTGTTLFMTLLAGFSALLARYADQRVVVVGSPIANRTRGEFEPVIGCFSNMLALRTDLGDDPTVAALIARVRQATLEAYENQDLPFEQLVEVLELDRSLSRHPLIQVVLVLQNTPVIEVELPEIEIAPFPIESPIAKFDLTLSVTESRSGLEGVVEYATDLFETETILRLIGHLEALLDAMVADPGARLSALPWGGDDMGLWRSPQRPRPSTPSRLRCLHESFETQVEAAPNAPALVFEERVLDYREVDARANRLAHHLRGLGVGPEGVVGLCLERSPSLVVGMLAVLKAGGAYLPLDPDYPAERVRHMLADSGARVVVTGTHALAEKVSGLVPTVCLEKDAAAIAREPDYRLPPATTPANLAYLIYTSGSTGRPKGVMVTHANAARLFETTRAAFRFEATDTWTLFHSFAFDFSVWEIWGALLHGARLVVVPYWVTRSPEAFRDLLARERVTVLSQTPAAFYQLLPELTGDASQRFALRWVVFGGEALGTTRLAPWFERFAHSQASLVNMYGITETTVHVTHRALDAEDCRGAGTASVGWPLEDLTAQVLDRHGRRVPAGVPGELYVGGAGLARGYLGRPGLTAERFVPDPFGTEPGARLYRTGDRARMRPDGEIEYLGRLDDQVKLRGFRIELGEIEARLIEHPAVAEAAVILRQDERDRPQLVAYTVAPEGAPTVAAEVLREHLAARLPDYMVPSAFASLEALPLTGNGKLDRARLPAPQVARAGDRRDDPPRTLTEEIVAGIWSQVLGRAVGGRESDFFALGGHSLLATQVRLLLNQQLGVEVPLRTFFQAPTVAALAAQVDECRRAGLEPLPAVEPRPRDRPPPLSFAQERLWFLDQLTGPQATYNLPMALGLRGAIDADAMRRAFEAIVARHEVLRTLFAGDGAGVRQVIREQVSVPLPLVDLSALPPAVRAIEGDRLAREEARQPFDLAAGPLLRTRLVRLAEHHHRLLLSVHHVVADGWSMGILAREFSQLYAALSSGTAAALGPLPWQYADFAAWQRRWLGAGTEARQLDYWRQRLAGLALRLDLPTDHPRPRMQRFRGARVPVRFRPDLSERLRRLAHEQGATLFMTLLAGWYVLLARYSGETDLAVGAPVANRHQPGSEPLIGFFANTLVLRTDLAGNPSVRDLLARVRETALGAYDHQDAPFEHLVEALRPERSLEHHPLVQVVLALQNAPPPAVDITGVEVHPIAIEHPTAKFDLTLDLMDTQDGLHGNLDYDADLFEPATARRLIQHLLTLLEAMSADADARIGELPMLSAPERRTLLLEWNATARDYPRTLGIAEAFEAQVERTPQAVALVCADLMVSYRALDRKANALAHELRAVGVGPESLVGICIERSVEMIVGLLAILKAGGAYVPLDPVYPPPRLAFMLADSGVRVLLTQSHLVARVAEHDARILCLDAPRPAAPGRTSPLPRVACSSDQLAYVCYTSGSTGRPKGVAVSQRSVLRLVKNPSFVCLDEREVVLQLAPLAFDASTFEVWGSLLNGAQLVVMPPENPSLEDLGRALCEHRITTLWLTAGLFHLMVDERLADLRGVRQLLAGGDVLSVPHVRCLLEAHPGCTLVNGYGPTEGTTFTCCFPMHAATAIGASVPIGYPIGNTRVYVLDAGMQPVPVGVPGELFIGGDGLARGYLQRPGLTAERFVPDPLGEVPGERLYRTGDRVRYQTDGTLEFIGRIDRQVKVRGFRVEPGEVEVVLAAHPQVRDVVVTVRDNAAAGKHLVAYAVPAPDETLLARDLRRYLNERLPDHMVPATFVLLEELPLNANGKVDRDALPEPQLDDAREPSTQTKPRDPEEEILAGLWAEVLGLERVGIDEGFFDLGGHSLMATRVVSRIRDRFGVELPLRRLFEAPTVAGTAQAVRAIRAEAQPTSPPLVALPGTGPHPLSFAQERLWFLNELEPENPFYNTPLALRLSGILDVASLEHALDTLVERHQLLRTTFANRAGTPVQVIAPHARATLSVLDLRSGADPEAEMRRVATLEAKQPFDLERGPLIRTRLLLLAADEQVLLITMHHVISDGWSLGVMTGELAALYQAGLEGRPAPLAPLPVQYTDFARWQRDWLSGVVLERQLGYWRAQLQDAPPALAVPTDRPRPAVQTFRGRVLQFTVDPPLRARLEGMSRRHGVTLFMTLLSAFATVLYRHSGQADLVIGSPIANRTRSEIEGLIGFFVNTLALRIDLRGRPAFAELLERVRQVALEAYAHQDLPFERLVDELRLERDLSRNPLFQVMFTLQNAPAAPHELPGLTITPVELERASAQFDLVLDFWEVDDGLTGVLEFATDLFDEASMRRLADHLLVVLAGVVANPGQAVDELPLMTREEHARVLAMGEGERCQYPAQTIGSLFAEQVQAGPERTAIVHGDASLDYVGLAARARRIAHWLRSAGLGANAFVAVYHERGVEFLAAILGVLEARAAFVPIDTTYPPERIRHMLRDSGADTIITRGALATRLGAMTDQFSWILCLDGPPFDEPGPTALDHRPDDPAPDGSPDDIAYLLYTSGSTGRPKGAMVRHDGTVNHVFAERDALGLDRDTVFLQSAPASSDVSVWQFLGPVLLGGRVVVVDYETVCDPARLLELMQRQAVTLIELVPVVMQALLQHAEAIGPELSALPRLRCAMVTGEAPPAAVVNHWLRLYPRIPLVNAYGPTEAADDVCQATITAPLPEPSWNVPIGRAIRNTSMYVLDPRLEPVPIGVPGEICVAGTGVGAGYWRDPALTAARFVPNPHAGAGPVLYRTGDLGRWRADAALEFLGRLDHQLEVRGFRVEPGEIEAVLLRHRAVAEAAVIERGEGEAKRLVAYLVPDLGALDGEAKTALERQQVGLWRSLHDESHQVVAGDDPTFNTIGWDSSYTGEALPADQMREYIDHTVELALANRPQRVLEIGCGAGLLAYRIAPRCAAYWGTDISGVLVEQLGAGMRALGYDNATVLQRAADDLTDLPEALDAVLLCSVIQYFPSIDYLLRVLARVLERLAPGGTVLVGDVRSLALLRGFHTSVEIFKAAQDLPSEELERRVEERLAREQELAVDPGFFRALPGRLSGVARVEISPKRGQLENELIRFRYDVVIHAGGAPQPQGAGHEPSWTDWAEWQPGPAELRQRLLERPVPLAIRRIPNARLREVAATQACLATRKRFRNAGQIRAAVASGSGPACPSGLDPEALHELASSLGYELELRQWESRPDGAFDAIFRLRMPGGMVPGRPLPAPEPVEPWHRYANNPLQEKLAQALAPELREKTKQALPEHMVPRQFVLLAALPLTPAGKVDRENLPAVGVAPMSATYEAPATPAERALVAIWAEVLGLDPASIGVGDNFFERGGHSLKATQVVSRVQRDLGAELPLRAIFSHPTIGELAALLADGGASPASAGASIERVPDARHFPLSHAQRRLWVLAQMEGGSVAYNMPDALHLAGDIDASALKQALDRLVARHESLRTTFELVAGEPRQRIREQIEIDWQVLDLSGEPQPEARARTIADAEAARPFDLARGPLLRASLLRLGARDQVLLFNVHHIVSDDWSTAVMVREIAHLYDALANGGPLDLPELRLQYRDYACWQVARLEGGALDAEGRWWRAVLVSPLPLLDLPTDRPRPRVKTYRGDDFRLRLDESGTRALDGLARGRGASLYMVLVTAIKALLHRYTGQTDLIVGCPIAGRQHTELEDQIGFYINTLALRDRVFGTMSFGDLLESVRHTTTGAYDHQAYPFDRLVGELDLPRHVDRSPVFDVMVALQNVDPYELKLAAAVVRPFEQAVRTTQFDLTFNCMVRDGCLLIDLRYNADLFRPESIARLGEHLRRILVHGASAPATPIRELPMLRPEERQQELHSWNATHASYPAEQTLVGLFEARVAAAPDRIALVNGDERLTYRELNRRANRLAHALRARDVKRDTLVAVRLERSSELVVALIGVLKAGGAYLPTPPSLPAERLRYLLEDAGIEHMITSTALAADAHAALACVIAVDAPAASDVPEADPPRVNAPADLAYCIYTSGSTGKPKGVLVEHRNVVRLLVNDRLPFAFGAQDVWSLFHSYGFDFSVWELWGALGYGGTLVLVPEPCTRDPARFLDLIEREGVTVLNQTPSAFYQLAAEACRRTAPALSLRYVVFGGEALQPALLARWRRRFPEVALINMYGITETTVHVTYKVIDDESIRASESNIGSPIPTTTVYVLDEALQPQPVGVEGELCVGGAGVARGYLNRDHLTRERFVPNPHLAGDRLYRSGDRGKRLANGDLLYLGRRDDQVQVRGFRIELTEVEAALAAHPGVAACAVVARKGDGTHRLAAYYVQRPSAEPASVTLLRDFLAATLPAYMIPTSFTRLSHLPLTPNGKLDREALPDPALVPAVIDAAFVPPRSGIERRVADIWCEVLRCEQVGREDNFFEVGGDSLGLVGVRARIRDTLGIELPVTELFRYPTVAALTSRLEHEEAAAPDFRDSTARAAKQRAAKRRRAERKRDGR